MQNKYRIYGAKKQMVKTAKFYGKQLSRDKVQDFKAKFPRVFSKLLDIQNGEREEGKRVEGRLKARHLFDFLYPDHSNKCLLATSKPLGRMTEGSIVNFALLTVPTHHLKLRREEKLLTSKGSELKTLFKAKFNAASKH